MKNTLMGIFTGLVKYLEIVNLHNYDLVKQLLTLRVGLGLFIGVVALGHSVI